MLRPDDGVDLLDAWFCYRDAVARFRDARNFRPTGDHEGLRREAVVLREAFCTLIVRYARDAHPEITIEPAKPPTRPATNWPPDLDQAITTVQNRKPTR